jgi:hypothetical protein
MDQMILAMFTCGPLHLHHHALPGLEPRQVHLHIHNETQDTDTD